MGHRLLLALLLLALAGCSADTEEPAAEPGGFFPDAAAEGPRLWIEVEGSGAGRRIALRAAELGAVLGVAGHLVLDPAFFTIEGSTPGALGVGEADALLHEVAPGDLALGIARPGGELIVEEPALLAEVSVTLVRAGSVRIEPSRVMVRRADGSHVVTAVLGGSLAIGAGEVQP